MEHFWFVWNETGSVPTFKHPTPESARREAEKLARMTPGQSFHVLQVIATARYQTVAWHEYGEFVPF